MMDNQALQDTIEQLKSAIESADKGKEYDAISLAYRLFGDELPQIKECYDEAVRYNGTTTRNATIIQKLLERYQHSSNGALSEKSALITVAEKGLFLNLFNRGGYVLNFTTTSFDAFTMELVGVPLCEHYQQSKGASLASFLHQAQDPDIISLLLGLFDYYEANYEHEYLKNPNDAPYFQGYDEEMSRRYQKCKKIVLRIRGNSIPLTNIAEELKEKFSSEYMNQQFDIMLSLCDTNPTEAIGKSKELIESCCKTVLEETKTAINKDWSVGQLAGEVLNLLRLTPESIPQNVPLADTMKAILGNLRSIATKMAELRNPYGSGHGKSASYRGLEKRHARLAVGSCITFVEFIWSTYEERNADAK